MVSGNDETVICFILGQSVLFSFPDAENDTKTNPGNDTKTGATKHDTHDGNKQKRQLNDTHNENQKRPSAKTQMLAKTMRAFLKSCLPQYGRETCPSFSITTK